VTVVCGAIEGDPAEPNGATITNPTVLVEVLSPSTEEEDRSNKWRHYQLLASLREYVLVSQSPPRIEVFRRVAEGVWEYRDVREGTMQLAGGEVLDLAALYAGLPE